MDQITESEIEQILTQTIQSRVANLDIHEIVHSQIKKLVDDSVGTYHWPNTAVSSMYSEDTIIDGVVAEFRSRTEQFITKITHDIQSTVINEMYSRINAVDIATLVRTHAETVVSEMLQQGIRFPDASITGSSVDFNTAHITGNNVVGGVHKLFASTGIEDLAKKTELVIEDGVVVVENQLITRNLEVVGDIKVHGGIDRKFIDRIVSAAVDQIVARLPQGVLDTEQVDYDQVVNLVVRYCQNRVSSDITDQVKQLISGVDVLGEIQTIIEQSVLRSLSSYQWPGYNAGTHKDHPIVDGLIAEFQKQTTAFLSSLEQNVRNTVITNTQNAVNSFDIHALIREQTHTIITTTIRNSSFAFPDRSIPSRSIDTTSLTVSADNISPGIIRNFESTGIQDRAGTCQLTIMDDHIIAENTLVARDVTVNGNLTIQGSVNADFVDRVSAVTLERINQQHSSAVFDGYVNQVFDRLNTEGIDPGKIRIHGRKLVEDNQLAPTITLSNLTKLGRLQELVVSGETLIADTVYISNHRLGINTIEPGNVIDIWDQEVQITGGKRSRDTGFIGTSRNQTLLITTNNRDQLAVNPDGSVTINRLNIGRTLHYSGTSMPLDNRPSGTVVWNEDPKIGDPIGWVSLGGARWARFGTITE